MGKKTSAWYGDKERGVKHFFFQNYDQPEFGWYAEKRDGKWYCDVCSQDDPRVANLKSRTQKKQVVRQPTALGGEIIAGLAPCAIRAEIDYDDDLPGHTELAVYKVSWFGTISFCNYIEKLLQPRMIKWQKE